MIFLALLIGMPQPRATLATAYRQDSIVRAFDWVTVTRRGAERHREPVRDANRYREEVQSVGTTFAISDKIGVVYAEHGTQMGPIYAEGVTERGLIVVPRNGRQKFIPVPSTVFGLKFLDGGRRLVAVRSQGPTGRTTVLSRIYEVGASLTPIGPWRKGYVIASQGSGRGTIEDFSPGGARLRRMKISGAGSLGQRLQALAAVHDRVLRSSPYRLHGGDYYGSIQVSPDVRAWYQRNFYLFHGEGMHQFDVFYGADALLDRTGIRWLWKHRNGERVSGMTFSEGGVSFLIRQPIDMGPPGHPKRYPAGLYSLDFRTWKVTRSPLSDPILKLGPDVGDLVSVTP